MTEAEKIIINKDFEDLSPQERDIVAELAENKEDYDQLKWFLTMTEKAVADEKISPSDKLRSSVLGQLETKVNTATKEKPKRKIYQMPWVQVGAAAMIIVGFLLFTTRVNENAEMAVNQAENKERIETLPDEKLDSLNSNGLTEEMVFKNEIPARSEEESQEEFDVVDELAISSTGTAVEKNENEEYRNDNHQNISRASEPAPLQVEFMDVSADMEGQDDADIHLEVDLNEEISFDTSLYYTYSANTYKSADNKTEKPEARTYNFSTMDIGTSELKESEEVKRKKIMGNAFVAQITAISIVETPELTNLFFTLP